MVIDPDPRRRGALPHTPQQASYQTLWRCLPTLRATVDDFGGPFACYAEAGGAPLDVLPRGAEELRQGESPWADAVAWAARSELSDPEGEALDRCCEGIPDVPEGGFVGLARTGAVGYVIEGLRQLLRDQGGMGEQQIDDILASAGEVARAAALVGGAAAP